MNKQKRGRWTNRGRDSNSQATSATKAGFELQSAPQMQSSEKFENPLPYRAQMTTAETEMHVSLCYMAEES